jgi:hypothetical protein
MSERSFYDILGVAKDADEKGLDTTHIHHGCGAGVRGGSAGGECHVHKIARQE